MEYGKWLIDKAAEVCGSRYALAQRTGLDQGSLSRWATGRAPLPTKHVPALAALAGVDAGESVLRVLAERAGAKKPPLRVAGFAHLSGLGYTIAAAAGVSLTPETLTRVIAWIDTLRIVSNTRSLFPTARPTLRRG